MIYTGAYGYRDLENKKPLDSKHIFRIASISKSFTATSIMQLVDAGKVSLDEDVSNLIGFTVRNPKFPDKIISSTNYAGVSILKTTLQENKRIRP